MLRAVLQLPMLKHGTLNKMPLTADQLIARYKAGGYKPLTTQDITQQANNNVGATIINDSVPGPDGKPIKITPDSLGPTTPTPSNSLVDRLTASKNNLENSGAYTLPVPDENAIKAKKAEEAQAYINAINQKFATIEANDTATIDLMNRERRASNVLSGLTGGTVGSARTIETAKAGDTIRANTAKQKEAEIATILGNANARATEEFRTQQNAYIQNSKDKLLAEQTLANNIKNTALNELSTFATRGKTFDDLATTNPKLISQYMKETGMDENQLKQYFLTKLPTTDLIDPTGTKLADGTVTYHTKTYDSNGNVTGIKEVARITGTGNKPIEQTSISPDGVFILYKDGTTEFKSTYTGKPQPKPTAPTVNEKNLASAGLKESDKTAQTYFLATPSAFQDEWVRNVSLGKQTGTSTEDLHRAYTKWYDENKKKETITNIFQ